MSECFYHLKHVTTETLNERRIEERAVHVDEGGLSQRLNLRRGWQQNSSPSSAVVGLLLKERTRKRLEVVGSTL